MLPVWPLAQTPGAPAPRGELALIRQIGKRAAAAAGTDGRVRLGIGDDCAVLRAPAGHDLLVTTDFSLEGRHFLRAQHPPESVGHRTLARGLSDLAAMGAGPLAVFLSLALPKAMGRDDAWLDRFLDGFLALAREHGVTLAGGDTAEAPGGQVLADVMLAGSAPRGTELRRSGARVGDGIYCTGALGGAAAELEAVLAGKKRRAQRGDSAGQPHLFPAPRVRLGEALRRRKLATACIDLSDGLSTDLAHLCEASAVRAELDAAAIPLHPLAMAYGSERALALALNGGEDYELLFTAREGVKVPRTIEGVRITRIGTVRSKNAGKAAVEMLLPGGKRVPVERGGWEHLR